LWCIELNSNFIFPGHQLTTPEFLHHQVDLQPHLYF